LSSTMRIARSPSPGPDSLGMGLDRHQLVLRSSISALTGRSRVSSVPEALLLHLGVDLLPRGRLGQVVKFIGRAGRAGAGSDCRGDLRLGDSWPAPLDLLRAELFVRLPIMIDLERVASWRRRFSEKRASEGAFSPGPVLRRLRPGASPRGFRLARPAPVLGILVDIGRWGVAVVPRAQIVVVELEGGPARADRGYGVRCRPRLLRLFRVILINCGRRTRCSRRLGGGSFRQLRRGPGCRFRGWARRREPALSPPRRPPRPRRSQEGSSATSRAAPAAPGPA